MSIIIKSDKEVGLMAKAGKIVAEVLQILKSEVRAGVSTIELDEIAARESARLGARPSFKGYRGYPANICISINEEIVHGIPDKRKLENGDLVSIDFGVIYEGYQGDAALTVGVGNIAPKAMELMKTTESSLSVGIKEARPGARLGDISNAIQQYVESRGFNVIREYTGHGIGRDMHEDPQIPNFGPRGQGPILKKGMTIALEPMVCTGDWHTIVGSNNWTVSTADGGLAAHFEHTVAITDGNPRILTAL